MGKSKGGRRQKEDLSNLVSLKPMHPFLDMPRWPPSQTHTHLILYVSMAPMMRSMTSGAFRSMVLIMHSRMRYRFLQRRVLGWSGGG